MNGDITPDVEDAESGTSALQPPQPRRALVEVADVPVAGQLTYKTPPPPPPDQSTLAHTDQGKRKLSLPLLVLLLLLLLALVAGTTWWAVNRNKAAPGTQIGAIDVSGMSRAEIEAEVRERTVDLPITLIVAGEQHSMRAGDLGVSVDALALAQQALDAGARLELITRLNPLSPKLVELVVDYDIGVLQTAISAFSPPGEAPKLPTIIFDDDTQSYNSIWGSSGWGPSAATSIEALQAAVASGTGGVIEVAEGLIEPSVSNASADQMAAHLNRLLSAGLVLSSQAGTAYEFSAQDLVTFIHLDTDSIARVFVLNPDREAIAGTLAALGSHLGSKGVDRFVLVDAHANELGVIREAQSGWGINDVWGSAELVAQALISGEPTADVELAPIDPGTKRITVGGEHEGHWVDVHLDSQTATLFDGATPIKTFLVSGGLPATPTPQGSFQIAVKELDSTITGADYEYSGVIWVGWNNMYALHSAYWHDNFGEPMSHGCINMRKAEVLEVYDWLDYGDWVEVHP